MSHMQKFQSIEQFRHAVSLLRKYAGGQTVKFWGTVKLHGTNGGIRLDSEDNLIAVSRNNVLTVNGNVGSDNAGFAVFVNANDEFLRGLLKQVKHETGETDVTVFGEWAGGNIQTGVALNGLDKFFAPFSLQNREGKELVTDVYSAKMILSFYNPDRRIYPVWLFGEYEIDVDPNYPEIAQEKLIALTEAVEAECPAGKYFGVSGIGEGIVWSTILNGYDIRFKVKGEKHSVSKVRTLAPVDIERVNSIAEFVESFVTDARLSQAMDFMKEQGHTIEMKNFSHFIKWIQNDLMKEEADTMLANNLTMKDIGGTVARKAKAYFEKAL